MTNDTTPPAGHPSEGTGNTDPHAQAMRPQASPELGARLAELRVRYAEWLQRQFGDVSAISPAKHLSKEALEVAAAPTDAEMAALRAELDALRAAIEPFANFAQASGFSRIPDDMPMTQGSAMARRQVTAGDFKRALAALKGGAL